MRMHARADSRPFDEGLTGELVDKSGNVTYNRGYNIWKMEILDFYANSS